MADSHDKITQQAHELEKLQTSLHKLKEEHSGLRTKFASLEHENANLKVFMESR